MILIKKKIHQNTKEINEQGEGVLIKKIHFPSLIKMI